MAKEKRKKGRKQGTGVKSKIAAQREQPVDIAFKLEHRIREWIVKLNAALRKYEANFGSLPDKFLSEINPDEFTNSDWVEKVRQLPHKMRSRAIASHDLLGHIEYLWSRHRAEHEEATQRGNADWFRHQADALEPKDSAAYAPPNLGRFERKVFDALFIRAHSYDNHEDYLYWARPRFMKEGCTAQQVLNMLHRREERFYTAKQIQLCEEKGIKQDQPKKGVRLVVEGRRFKDARRTREAITRIAKRFGFGLRDEQGKHSNPSATE
jgi:hypothetical protein